MKKVYDESLIYVGGRIKDLRRRRGYSQESFAEALEVSVEEILGSTVKIPQKC